MIKKSPKAALIVIGNEILSGRTADVHTKHLANRLKELSIPLVEVRIVPDTMEAIIAAVRALKSACDYLFTTGGIGPTHDDITIDAIAAALGVEVITHKDAYALLASYYSSQETGFTDARKRMSRSPEGATMIANPVSCAPGFQIENIFILAGVPKIAHAMLDNVMPKLQRGMPMFAKTLRIDLPESAMMEVMIKAEADYDVRIGSYPSYHRKMHGVAIVVRGSTEHAVKDAITLLTQHIKQHNANYTLLDGEC